LVRWLNFYGEKLLAPRPTPKLEDLLLSAVRNCLIYSQLSSTAAGRSSISNLRTRHAVMTGTHSSRKYCTRTHAHINMIFVGLMTRIVKLAPNLMSPTARVSKVYYSITLHRVRPKRCNVILY
jgi:hypothetical protein